MPPGLGLNKPCVKCGREVPAGYKSPIPGYCGRCTDEVLKLLRASPGGGSQPAGSARQRAIEAAKSPAGIGGFALGMLFALLGAAALAILTPGSFDSAVRGLRGLF
ncbi:MAG: hypothetical protein L0216_12675 [Planctomycetales bacterium]|nr:hypothetical protein [Planctomycetales bacterium]